ncbi:MAG: CoB--CoM heterodisulfide reductase iron-sulfur subunit B family protein [Proteobacteria bacterium]|nr:CoB--CoM heterodisulfide reductase iron-sulfur subunit B family protein [Pseudomonadota bacterium]
MKFAVQRCCTTSVYLKQYETSTDAVLKALGVEFVDIREFNCCGYPLKNVNAKASLLASARNLSLAEREDLNILTFCNCCYGTLKHVNHTLKEEPEARKEANRSLEKEGLRYEGRTEIKHLFEVLFHDIGVKGLQQRLVKKFTGLKIATHYGCHILRPRKITQFDNPVAPTIFDKLVEITGASSIPWAEKLECCGSPMWGVSDELSLDLTEKKVADAKQSGADYLCCACAFCQLQFDRVQRILQSRRGKNHNLPSVLYTQLIGLGLGIDAEVLGITRNELDATGIMGFLS